MTFAMHVADGVLPLPWTLFWLAVAAPFLWRGLRELERGRSGIPHFRALVALAGAALLVVSSTPIPVPTAGTCSHACGTGLVALVIGPSATVLAASVVLCIQAIFLGDGGITTLGADLVSMGVVGAYVGFATFGGLRRLGVGGVGAAFGAGLLSDWAPYLVTSLQLGLGTAGTGSVLGSTLAILAGYLPAQVPLGILEGLVCAAAWRYLAARRPELLCHA